MLNLKKLLGTNTALSEKKYEIPLNEFDLWERFKKCATMRENIVDSLLIFPPNETIHQMRQIKSKTYFSKQISVKRKTTSLLISAIQIHTVTNQPHTFQ